MVGQAVLHRGMRLSHEQNCVGQKIGHAPIKKLLVHAFKKRLELGGISAFVKRGTVGIQLCRTFSNGKQYNDAA